LSDACRAFSVPHAAWRTDGMSLRVKGRFAVACPTPGKAIRKLTLTP